MGQTDEREYEHKFYDHDGMLWTWWLCCPYCGEALCIGEWAEQLYGDDVIGCDDCCMDVAVDDATWALYDENGNAS